MPLLPPPTASPVFRFTLRSAELGRHVCATDPLGWGQVGVALHRDPKTHGIGAEYTAQLGFVGGARAYLERVYQAAGVEGEVTLAIDQLDPDELEWAPYYAGRVNLVSRELTDLEFRANVEKAGFWQTFLNRDAVQVDLFSGTSVGGSAGPVAAPVPVVLHSRTLQKRFYAVVTSAQVFGGPIASAELDGMIVEARTAADARGRFRTPELMLADRAGRYVALLHRGGWIAAQRVLRRRTLE